VGETTGSAGQGGGTAVRTGYDKLLSDSQRWNYAEISDLDHIGAIEGGVDGFAAMIFCSQSSTRGPVVGPDRKDMRVAKKDPIPGCAALQRLVDECSTADPGHGNDVSTHEESPLCLVDECSASDRAHCRNDRPQKESALEWAIAIDSMDDAIHIVDSDLRVVRCNTAFAQWCLKLGVPAEVVGRGLLDALPFLPPSACDEYRYVLDTGRTLVTKETMRVGAGDIATETRKIPIVREGVVSGVVTVIRDITQLRRAEEALRKSEATARAIFNATTDTVVLVDREGNILAVNEVGAGRLAKRPHELVGANIHDILPPGIATRRMEKCDEVVQSRKHVRFEDERAGRIVDNSLYPVFDAAGDVCAIAVYGRDITEERKAQEALERIFFLSVDMICVLDTDGNFRRVNPAFTRVLGYENKEVTGRHFLDFVHPDDVQATVREVEQRLSDGSPTTHFDNRCRCRDGSYRWLEWAATYIREEGLTYAVVRDITDREDEERKALEESRERFRSIVESTSDWIWEVDANGVYTYASPKVRDILGYDPEEVIGKTPFDLMPPDESERIGTEFRAIVQARRAFERLENCNLHRDGRLVLLETSGVPIIDKDGNLLGYRGIGRDVTERKQAEELRNYSEQLEKMVDLRTRELRDAQDALVRKEKLAVLGQLAGGVGHELRNPLGVISNAVYYLETKLSDADRAIKKHLALIASEVQHSEEIVSDLLEFSRTKPGKKEEIAISVLVAQVLERYTPPQKVKVTITMASDLPLVFVDSQQTRQVIGNLVTNAYEAMPDGGELFISAHAEDREVQLLVRDTGCGISHENMKMLFEPLFTTKEKGIGLGLAVSRILAQANGGSITAESEEGKGATFVVTFPVLKEENPCEKEGASETAR